MVHRTSKFQSWEKPQITKSFLFSNQNMFFLFLRKLRKNGQLTRMQFDAGKPTSWEKQVEKGNSFVLQLIKSLGLLSALQCPYLRVRHWLSFNNVPPLNHLPVTWGLGFTLGIRGVYKTLWNLWRASAVDNPISVHNGGRGDLSDSS